jgi:hypothetical protein
LILFHDNVENLLFSKLFQARISLVRTSNLPFISLTSFSIHFDELTLITSYQTVHTNQIIETHAPKDNQLSKVFVQANEGQIVLKLK